MLLASLQVGILITGNYGFFNLLSVSLYDFLFECLLLQKILIPFSIVPDTVYPQFLRNMLGTWAAQNDGSENIWLNLAIVTFVGMTMLVSLVPFSQVARGNLEIPDWISRIQSGVSRYGLMNYYGLFARMTTTRHAPYL